LSAKKILVVDDDPDLRLALGVRLRAHHYQTTFAADGVAAISSAQKERPDLILLDLGLPGGDGFRVLERFRAIPRLACIPVIVLTARSARSTEDQVLRLGVNAFFQKPVDNQVFLAAIRQVLGE
jgi:DNA-binding response OmpR family regulator